MKAIELATILEEHPNFDVYTESGRLILMNGLGVEVSVSLDEEDDEEYYDSDLIGLTERDICQTIYM